VTSKTIAIIPARAGSTRCHDKHTRMMAGKPMIQWTLDAALKARNVDAVCVSTNDSQVMILVNKYVYTSVSKLCWIDEPDSARVTESTQLEYPQLHDVFAHIPNPDQWTCAVVLQPTSPMRTTTQIEHAIEAFAIKRALTPPELAISMVGVHRSRSFTWTYNGDWCVPDYDIDNRPRSQDIGFVRCNKLIENGSFYLFEPSRWRRMPKGTSRLRADRVFPHIVDEWTALEVDTEEDFSYIEGVIGKRL
jgi:CMP-N,N'-diacetyllegionaminic acid synthase